MDMKLECVVLKVSDVDRAKEFYERAGFHCDVDHHASDEFRVVQFTPPGSACSITFGIGVDHGTPAAIQGLHLVVTDIETARDELIDRGVEVSEPFHFGSEGQVPGVDPDHRNYNTVATFSDPDGNGFLLQEVGHPSAGS